MINLTASDLNLIQSATKVIKENYDFVKYNHTVGAAVRCKNGNTYVGVNVYSVHGACAEVVTIGTAISAGEREFECIVAVGGDNLDKIYSPCGNCRQFLMDYAPDCDIIVSTQQGDKKVKLTELLPFAYHRTD